MRKRVNYRKVPLSLARKMVIASVDLNKKNAIHCLTKIDVTIPRKIRDDFYKKTGKKISFNAYILKCFAETFKEFPEMNSFIRGNNQIILEDINISLMVEREMEGVKIPEPMCISRADSKSISEIQGEIRKAQANTQDQIGSLSGSAWIKLIPAFLFRFFIKLAERSINMTSKYGKIAMTSPGMYTNSPSWFIPHGTATVFLVVGNIYKECVLTGNCNQNEREILNVTFSFDHELIDGAPAARFVSHFEKILKAGEFMSLS